VKPLCELISTDILPAVRAMIAKKLIENYGLSQKQTAEKLGTTQPAVSQYKRDIRGYKTGIFKESPELMKMVNSIAKSMASGEMSKAQSTVFFCEICKHIRFGGIGCRLHRESDPSLESCEVCFENEHLYGKKPGKKSKTEKEKINIKPLSKF